MDVLCYAAVFYHYGHFENVLDSSFDKKPKDVVKYDDRLALR